MRGAASSSAAARSLKGVVIGGFRRAATLTALFEFLTALFLEARELLALFLRQNLPNLFLDLQSRHGGITFRVADIVRKLPQGAFVTAALHGFSQRPSRFVQPLMRLAIGGVFEQRPDLVALALGEIETAQAGHRPTVSPTVAVETTPSAPTGLRPARFHRQGADGERYQECRESFVFSLSFPVSFRPTSCNQAPS